MYYNLKSLYAFRKESPNLVDLNNLLFSYSVVVPYHLSILPVQLFLTKDTNQTQHPKYTLNEINPV